MSNYVGVQLIEASNQGDVINALEQELRNRGLYNDGNYKIVRRGICFALSELWLARSIDTGKAYCLTGFAQGNAANKDLLYQIAQLQFALMTTNAPGFAYGAEAIANFSGIVRGIVEDNESGRVTNAETSLTVAPSVNVATLRGRDRSELIGFLYWSGVNGAGETVAHQMALYAVNGSVFFYDPNHGLFEVMDVADFLNGFADALANEFGYTTTYQKFYRVS